MKKGITIVLCANIIFMIFNILSNFILPKYLSIESYGHYKVFILYSGYIGIAHLGFVDGIYLKYGGKDFNTINSKELALNTSTLRYMQLLLMIVTLLIAFLMENPIVFFIALSFIPVNMVSYYKNIFQATGEFKNYSAILSILSILSFICNMFLVFVTKTDRYEFYILVIVISNLIVYQFLEFKSKSLQREISHLSFDRNLLTKNIRLGITLTIGNFASILITSIDRWFIQICMEISDFSYYSFAVSVENLYNVSVSAISTTLYNYLCKITDTNKIKRLKSFCIIIGVYLVAIAYPVKFIVSIWLKKYEASITCLFILISAHSFYFVIKAIYINLYKARGQQHHYLIQMLIVLTIAIVTNIIFYFGISKCKEAFAFATLFTAVLWYFICFFDLYEIRGRIHDNILILLSTVFYLLCGLLVDNALIGFVIYMIIVTLSILALSKDNFIELIEILSGMGIQTLSKYFMWRKAK